MGLTKTDQLKSYYSHPSTISMHASIDKSFLLSFALTSRRQIFIHTLMAFFFFVYFFRAGDKHLDSSSDSELDSMQGMMMPTSQNSSKGIHNSSNVGGNLQHNLLLQQGITSSQLGERFITPRICNACLN